MERIRQEPKAVEKCVLQTFNNSDIESQNVVFDKMNDDWFKSGTRLYP